MNRQHESQKAKINLFIYQLDPLMESKTVVQQYEHNFMGFQRKQYRQVEGSISFN